jgi:hypothetical protein
MYLYSYYLLSTTPKNLTNDPIFCDLGLPNVHIALHFQDFIEEYASIMNCNVLYGELKHKYILSMPLHHHMIINLLLLPRVFKKWAN